MPDKRTMPTDDDGARAFALAKTHLGEGTPGVTVAEDGSRAELSLLGVSYANVERAGRSVIASFLVHESDRPAISSLLGYMPDPIRAGWWRIRLGKEPRRWSEANVATLAGRTMAALRTMSNVGRWRNIANKGGSFALVNRAKLDRWEPILADARGPNEARVVTTESGPVLLLPASAALYLKREEHGLLLVQDVGPEPRDEHRLRELVTALPEDALAPTDLRLEVLGPLLIFDASTSGTALEPAATLTSDLDAGTYAVQTGVSPPSSKQALTLVRLVRVDRAPG
ncbi:MAG: hypothetical protein FJ096_19320 [Deltaproteobacteria bacterium]|nr:hypothetical protein [Deltaproteobacteria bacterium]